jgi:hypothetical protein
MCNSPAKIRTLGEEQQELEVEDALDDLAVERRLHGRVLVVVAEDRLLRAEVALAAEDELILHVLDLDRVGDARHVADQALQVRARQRHAARERRGLDAHAWVVEVQQVELERRATRDFRTLDTNTEVVGVAVLHEERQVIARVDRLHQLEEVEHVEADGRLVRAVVELELGRVELQVDEARLGRIHRHDPQAVLIEVDAYVRQELFESLDERLERRSLHRADLERVLRHGFCMF